MCSGWKRRCQNTNHDHAVETYLTVIKCGNNMNLLLPCESSCFMMHCTTAQYNDVDNVKITYVPWWYHETQHTVH